MAALPQAVEVTMPALHPGQLEIHRSRARFRVVTCGRRWGKTRLGIAESLEVAISGGRCWWVAPTYAMAGVAWRQMREIVQDIPGSMVRESERVILFPGGGEVWFKSSDNEQGLRGEGLDFLVMDECAFISERAWIEVLRPSLADRKGRALFISTPRGRNWFWRLWMSGNEGAADVASWQMPTASNPYIDPAEVEAARARLPERIYRQELMAEFLEDAGGLFRRVRDAATATEQDCAIEGHQYAVGVDWGKTEDFTVMCVLDLTTKELVALDRSNQLDYVVQEDRLQSVARRFKPVQIVAERNAMGEPIIERLQRNGLPVVPFLTTNATKASALEALALAFERGEIRILDSDVLINELEALEMDRLPSGLVRYAAPEGMHDDCVMALAMAWTATSDKGPFIL